VPAQNKDSSPERKVGFLAQLLIMLSLKFKLIRKEKTVVVTVMILSWLLFLVILLCFITRDKEKVSIKTIDMAYKALENFIFLSISGVFLFSQI